MYCLWEKISLDDLENIKHLGKLGLAHKITHRSLSFDKKLNTNATLDFYFEQLKVKGIPCKH